MSALGPLGVVRSGERNFRCWPQADPGPVEEAVPGNGSNLLHLNESSLGAARSSSGMPTLSLKCDRSHADTAAYRQLAMQRGPLISLEWSRRQNEKPMKRRKFQPSELRELRGDGCRDPATRSRSSTAIWRGCSARFKRRDSSEGDTEEARRSDVARWVGSVAALGAHRK